MKTETIMKLWIGALIGSVFVAIVWNVIIEFIK